MKHFDYSMLNLEDTIQVEDLTDRLEELESMRDELRDEFDADSLNDGVDFANWVRNQSGYSSEEEDEYQALKTLVEELASNEGA